MMETDHVNVAPASWRSLTAMAGRMRDDAPPPQAKALFIERDFISQTDLPRTLFDYAGSVRQGFDSNVVMAPVMWIMRTFTEAHAIVERKIPGKRLWDTVEDHQLEVLIDQPNEFYDGDALWKATCISYVLDGNAYWLKVRNSFGEVIELWYVPHWLIIPRWSSDGKTFITHYEYRHGNGPPEKLQPRDLVHFRFGLDPSNPRVGLSPLRALLREIFTDDEAANFSAKILGNMGVPGLVVSPKVDTYRPTDEDVEKFTTAFTGDNRGGALVLKRPMDVFQFGFDPNKLTLSQLRDVSEERVCAAIGLPAAVVGFGAGLQSTKVGATMRELRKLAWVQCLTPMQATMARQLTAQLLTDFQSQLRRFRVRFDQGDVAAFQEEDDIMAARITKLVLAGTLRVDRAQALLGQEIDETQEVYLRPVNTQAIDKNGKPVKLLARGETMLGPDGKPVAAAGLVGPDGQPIKPPPKPPQDGQPPTGADGQPVTPAPPKSDADLIAAIAERVLLSPAHRSTNGAKP